jgi:hypothetical protein
LEGKRNKVDLSEAKGRRKGTISVQIDRDLGDMGRLPSRIHIYCRGKIFYREIEEIVE